jgi:hypothetical protein
MSDMIKIENLEAVRGEKKTGYMNVGETAVGNVQIPLAIINGTRAGPTVCISGGVHGYEYSSILAVIRVIRQINPMKLSGALLIVPVLNLAGFETRGPQGGQSTPFQNPIDGINLNRIFPGNPDGTLSYQIVAAFMSKVVSHAEYYIDCHGGDLNEELTSYIGVAQTGNREKDNLAREILAASFNSEFISLSYGGGSSIDAAAKMGIPSIRVEAGGYGRVEEEAVKFTTDGINNVLKKLNMMEGAPVPTQKQRIRQRWSSYVKRGGVCHPLPLGTRVKKGDKVAEVWSIFGELLESIESPVDGYICFRRNPIPVSTNDRVVQIVPDEDLPPPPSRPYP